MCLAGDKKAKTIRTGKSNAAVGEYREFGSEPEFPMGKGRGGRKGGQNNPTTSQKREGLTAFIQLGGLYKGEKGVSAGWGKEKTGAGAQTLGRKKMRQRPSLGFGGETSG